MEIKLGYDLKNWESDNICLSIIAKLGHLIVVGGSGSGKTIALLYWLYNVKKYPLKLFICDFKKSGDFQGISDCHAEFEDCYWLIMDFYSEFLKLPEGGDGQNRILLIDEVAGLLTYFDGDKQKSAELRKVMATILMLGRSRCCYLWLSAQRYTASLFPVASGAGDNFHIIVGLGRLTSDGRKSLFSGFDRLDFEEQILGYGKGIVLANSQSLKGLVIPHLEKDELLGVIRK